MSLTIVDSGLRDTAERALAILDGRRAPNARMPNSEALWAELSTLLELDEAFRDAVIAACWAVRARNRP